MYFKRNWKNWFLSCISLQKMSKTELKIILFFRYLCYKDRYSFKIFSEVLPLYKTERKNTSEGSQSQQKARCLTTTDLQRPQNHVKIKGARFDRRDNQPRIIMQKSDRSFHFKVIRWRLDYKSKISSREHSGALINN